MSGVSTQLSYIKTKTYGEEVCDAICEAIRLCYNDVDNVSLREDAFVRAISEANESGLLSDSILGYLGILTENTSNLVNLLTSEVGLLNSSTGVVDTSSSSYKTTAFIPVTSGQTYYFGSIYRGVFYTGSSGSETYSTNFSTSSNWTAPSNGWIKVSFTNGNINSAKVNEGSSKTYRPGRAAVDHNLRDIVSSLSSNLSNNYYDKIYIDQQFGGIEDLIALTEDQKQDLIDLLDEEEE